MQKYWDENNQAERFPLEVDEEHEKNETNVPTIAIATTTASFEITSTITTTSTEETKSQDNSEDGPTEKELDAEEIAVKLEVKLEDSTEQEVVVKEESINIQEPAKNGSESASYPTASATNEDTQVKKETLFEEATETTIKQEEDVAVKEEVHPEEKSLLQYDDDIKPEDIPAVPVSERAQFWESKASTTTTTTTTTSTPRSNLPVSKTRLASSQK